MSSSSPHVLAVVGSLQARSSNAALVNAIQPMLGPAIKLATTRALHELPPFNPDNESENVPAPVVAWRAELAAAPVIILATPEYAFGIAGSLKNALDWVVGSGEFVGKPVALLGASTMATGAGLALEALERTIRVMSADVLTVVSVAHVRAKLDHEGNVIDEATRAALGSLAEKIIDRLTQ
jgi:chromate reductase